ncbi:heat shock protein 70, putative, partial [Bodo saltans]
MMKRGVFRPTLLLRQYRPQHTVSTDGRVHAQTVLEVEANRKLKLISEESARFVVEKTERSNSGRVIGVDLGTTNSCISYIDKETNMPRIIPSPTGSWVFPTAVTFLAGHNLRTFGEEARASVRTSASATLCSGKRLIGRRFGELGRVQSQLHKTNQLTMTEKGDVAVEIMGRTYTIVHITAMFLRYLKIEAEKFLKEPVDCIVVSVPAYFTPQQKVATEDAALCAGFDVLEVIDEPSAACLTYTVLNKDNPQMSAKRIHRSLVFDLGGGTLDCAILENDIKKKTFTLAATHGDALLGGNDWDTAISQRFQDQFEKKWKIPIEDPTGNV